MLIFYVMLLNKTIVLTRETSMHRLCNNIHNMAFIMNGRITRSTVLLELVNFIFGIGLGIALCSVIVH